MKPSTLQKYGIGLLAFGMLAGLSLSVRAEESPITLKAWVGAITSAEMQEIIKDGVSKAEMDSLPVKLAAGSLLAATGPLTLKAGENRVAVTGDILANFKKEMKNKAVAFVYELTCPKGADEKTTVKYQNFASKAAGDAAKINAKAGVWNVPAKSKKYRMATFRSAGQINHPIFTFELTVESGAASTTYTLILDQTAK